MPNSLASLALPSARMRISPACASLPIRLPIGVRENIAGRNCSGPSTDAIAASHCISLLSSGTPLAPSIAASSSGDIAPRASLESAKPKRFANASLEGTGGLAAIISGKDISASNMLLFNPVSGIPFTLYSIYAPPADPAVMIDDTSPTGPLRDSYQEGIAPVAVEVVAGLSI